MRVALLTAGGYPYRRDPLGALCGHLVNGLDRHSFHLVSLTERPHRRTPAYPLPGHVLSARPVALPPAAPARRTAGNPDREATIAAVLMCRGLLGDGPGDSMFATGLRRLAAASTRTAEPLRTVPLAEVLIDAWRTSRAAAERAGRQVLPRLSVRDASYAAGLLRRASRPLAARLPDADLVHAVGGTAAVLAALAHRWRTGTPLLFTEPDGALADRPGEEHLPPMVRLLLRRFRRGVAHTGYAAAGMVATFSSYHRDRALDHGADASKVVIVPAAADPARCPVVAETSARPRLLCPGVDTGPALQLLLDAFTRVLAAVPGAVLHLIGTTADPAQLRVQQTMVRDAGLGAAVRVSPPPPDRRPHYADAQIVVHVSDAGGPPHRLAEAMMHGRPVVAVDNGAAAETLGSCGRTVAPGDPEALGTACVELLGDYDRRAELGAAARRRAVAHFAPDRLVRAYQALYEDVTAPPGLAVPRYEFDLAVPAPRTPVPSTIAWLRLEER